MAILLLIALILFVAAAFGRWPNYELGWAGMAFFVLAILIGNHTF
jgi:hypothetical protein